MFHFKGDGDSGLRTKLKGTPHPTQPSFVLTYLILLLAINKKIEFFNSSGLKII